MKGEWLKIQQFLQLLHNKTRLTDTQGCWLVCVLFIVMIKLCERIKNNPHERLVTTKHTLPFNLSRLGLFGPSKNVNSKGFPEHLVLNKSFLSAVSFFQSEPRWLSAASKQTCTLTLNPVPPELNPNFTWWAKGQKKKKTHWQGLKWCTYCTQGLFKHLDRIRVELNCFAGAVNWSGWGF